MPNLIRATLLALVFSLLFARAAEAQVNRQDNEFAGNASLFQSFRGGAPNLTVGVHYGRLLRDFAPFGTKIEGLQVGGDVIFSGPIDFSGGGSLTLFPQARLYLTAKDPRFSPYVGLGLGLSVFKTDSVSVNFAYDVNGGVKYFLNPTTAAFLQLDLAGPITDVGSSYLIASVGLSVFF